MKKILRFPMCLLLQGALCSMAGHPPHAGDGGRRRTGDVCGTIEAVAQVKAGKPKALAVSGLKRCASIAGIEVTGAKVDRDRTRLPVMDTAMAGTNLKHPRAFPAIS